MTTADLNTSEALAELLRNAAAWLRLAADKLDDGDLDAASSMAKLGAFGVDGAPERIAHLSAAATDPARPCDDCGAGPHEPCPCAGDLARR